MKTWAVTLGPAPCVPQHPWAQQHEGRSVPLPLSEPVDITCESQQAFEPQQCGKSSLSAESWSLCMQMILAWHTCDGKLTSVNWKEGGLPVGRSTYLYSSHILSASQFPQQRKGHKRTSSHLLQELRFADQAPDPASHAGVYCPGLSY